MRKPLLLCLLWAACDGGEDAPGRTSFDASVLDAQQPADLSCSEGNDEYGLALAQDPLIASYAACNSDRDCVAWSPQLSCEGEDLTVYQCDRATRVDAREQTLQRNKVVSAVICPRIDPRCFVGQVCGSKGRARCVEGSCQIQYGGEDAGTDAN